MDNQSFRKLLGDFIKSHRQRTSPESAGLPSGHTYRRTPGLRREEVAQLANVSMTWYTWLEQGRDVSASPEVLESIGRVFKLTEAEREYMHKLAGQYVRKETHSSESHVTPAFEQMIRSMPYPCVALGTKNELIAWNAMACEVFIDFSLIPPEERTMLRLLFVNDALSRKVANGELAKRTSLAFFRKVYAPYSDQEWYTELIRELKSTSKEFAEWWTKHEITEKTGRQVNILHPEAGLLAFEIVTFLQIHEVEGIMCCMYAPIPGTGTAEKLVQLQISKHTDSR